MEVDIVGNITDFVTVNSDLISQHARCGNLDRIIPVVITETQIIGEVKDSLFANRGRVLCNIEMSRLYRPLRNGMWNKEEVKLSIDNFLLLNEVGVDVRALRRVNDTSVAGINFEESLSHSLVHDDESDVGLGLVDVLFSDDLFELFELCFDDLGSHGIANTISVDEHVVGQLSFVVLHIRLERVGVVILENCGRNDFFTLSLLWTCLRVVFAHERVVRSTISNDGLLAFVTYINANEHSFL